MAARNFPVAVTANLWSNTSLLLYGSSVSDIKNAGRTIAPGVVCFLYKQQFVKTLKLFTIDNQILIKID